MTEKQTTKSWWQLANAQQTWNIHEIWNMLANYDPTTASLHAPFEEIAWTHFLTSSDNDALLQISHNEILNYTSRGNQFSLPHGYWATKMIPNQGNYKINQKTKHETTMLCAHTPVIPTWEQTTLSWPWLHTTKQSTMLHVHRRHFSSQSRPLTKHRPKKHSFHSNTEWLCTMSTLNIRQWCVSKPNGQMNNWAPSELNWATCPFKMIFRIDLSITLNQW